MAGVKSLQPLSDARRSCLRAVVLGASLAFLLGVSSHAQGLFYELEVVAETGGATDDGETLDNFDGASINESGIVAFVADGVTASATIKRVYRSDSSGIPLGLGIAGDTRTTSSAQINAQGKIVAYERFLVGFPRPTVIRVWDALDPNTTPQPLFATNDPATGLNAIYDTPSIANNGTVFFGGFIASPLSRRAYLNTTGTQNLKQDVGAIFNAGDKGWVSSTGRYVLRSGQETGGLLVMDGPAEPRVTLATTGDADTYRIGNLPGISDSGKVAAFVLDDLTEGEGLYLFIDEPSDPAFDDPIKVLGFPDGADGLGFTSGDDYIEFDSFDFTNRVAVVHKEAGATGIEDDEIVVCFMATPDNASIDNPRTVSPLLFSDQLGVWCVHITARRNFAGTSPIRLDAKTSPLPVLQVGDFLGADQITGLSIYDPLAFAEKTTSGLPRVTIGPADHYVTIQVETAAGTRIVRGSHFDSDFDGLFDHWEQPGGGIDIDRDGTIDLVLADFGADPFRKDLFIEIDWSRAWRPEPFTDMNGNTVYDFGEPYQEMDGNGAYTVGTYVPDPVALQDLVTLFQNAPVPNPVGPPGIELRIDAGIARSVNMGPGATLDGGDEVVDPASGKFIHVVYSDATVYDPISNPGSLPSPPSSWKDNYGNPLVQTASQDIREQYSGITDRNARELAFRYMIFAQEIGGRCPGDVLGLAESVQFASRVLTPPESFTDTNGDKKWTAGDQFLDSNGNGVKDGSEPFFDGAGSSPGYDGPEPFGDTNGNGVWDPAVVESARSGPGNNIIFGLSATRAELTASGNLRVLFPNPGAPSSIPAPSGFFHYQVMLHELGHNLGLLHGGDDRRTALGRLTPKPQYRSVMNYGYTEYPDRDGVLIRDYSDGTSPGSFDDWAVVRLDFARHFDVLGGHFASARLVTTPDGPHAPSRTLDTLEATHDLLGPSNRPAHGVVFPHPDLIDGDGDGIVFLLEEALGMNPLISDIGDYPIEVGHEPGPGGEHFYMQYPRDTSLNISYQVERSGNGMSWSTSGISETVVSTVGSIETVKASILISFPGAEFLHLTVTRLP